MRSPDGPKGAGKKRKCGKSRDERIFRNFNTIGQYNEVVFVNPNLWDTLFLMQISSSPNASCRILRYASTSRRRHLGTNISRDRGERFISHCDNPDEIRAAEPQIFDHYVSIRDETMNVLGPYMRTLSKNPVADVD